MAQHNDLGRWGEQEAARVLEEKGWYIRHRDWRYGHIDIDIVCIDEDATMLLFVEVKTRSSSAYGDPAEAVDADKRRNIIAAASAYRLQNNMENLEWRYDIISIVLNDNANDNANSYKLRHIENAFSVIDTFEDRSHLARKRQLLKY